MLLLHSWGEGGDAKHPWPSQTAKLTEKIYFLYQGEGGGKLGASGGVGEIGSMNMEYGEIKNKALLFHS